MSRHDSQKTRVTIAGGGGPPQKSRPEEACIVVIYGPDIGRRMTLAGANFEIGRSSKNDLSIEQESISRNHARISFDRENTRYLIQDLGSTNGTFVNDVQVTTSPLRDGDQIHIGRSILKFMTGQNIEVHYHEELYRLMTVDALTQAYNRRYFDEALEREFNRARRYGQSLSLVLFDIDHFKKINDTWGHLAGDGMLRQLSAALRPRFRAEDIFARTGGEEFGLLLPQVPLDAARQLAEAVRRDTEALAMRYEQNTIPCTISLGVAQLSEVDRIPQDLYKRTDGGLYAAKQSGRNRCAVA